jgi:hypothetical protein
MISVTIGDKDFQVEWDTLVKSVRNPKATIRGAAKADPIGPGRPILRNLIKAL